MQRLMGILGLITLAMATPGYGLTATFGLYGPNGANDGRTVTTTDTTSVQLTVVLSADAAVTGLQYGIAVTKDGSDAGSQFAFKSAIQMDSQKYPSANPYAGNSRLETGNTSTGYQGRHGIFDMLGADSKFISTNYEPGYMTDTNGNSVADTPVATLADMNPELVDSFSTSLQTSIFPANVATYEIGPVGTLAAGTYIISVGAIKSFPMRVCTTQCVTPTVSSTYTLTVTGSGGGGGGGGGTAGDADGDGIPDESDNCPQVANNAQTDTDGDGQGDACDDDDDGDAILDASDNCPAAANANQADADGDGVGDACDTNDDSDTDGDGVKNSVDNCPANSNADQTDTDGDRTGDACDNDDDGDGIADASDNCPLVANATQTDTDNDGVGDACDTVTVTDSDGDGLPDTADNCPAASNADQADKDGDGQGNACDTDDDNDGVVDTADNCALVSNADQTDTDGDGQGDACDSDDDGDGVADSVDNCPLASNADQADVDNDGLGDVCDPTNNNGGNGSTPAPPPICGAGLVDTMLWSTLLGLWFVGRTRRR